MNAAVLRHLVVLSVALVLLWLPLSGDARADLAVWGDDGADRYLGRGGLLLPPGSASDQQRRSAASCAGCEWASSSMCVLADGSFPDGPAAPDCTPVPARCATGNERLVLWRSDPGGPGWQRAGTFCWTAAGPPPTTGQMAQYLQERFLNGLPAPVPAPQPAADALMNLPVVFADGSGASAQEWVHRVVGLTVTLRADPTWTWTFGDGSTLRGGPGGRYPDMSVTRTYRAPGSYPVTVEIAWPASYTVDGLGPFPIPEVVRTTGSAAVEVRPARAVLTYRD